MPWSPKAVITFFVAVFLLLTGGASATAFTQHALQLNENQILYLFSTTAQVIAAIYGLTLTGFIFFRNELSREELEDETLSEAVDSLKSRYFELLAFITVLVGFTLLLANLAIAYEGTGQPWALSVILNAGQASFITSLLAVAYFIFDVISPKRVARASQALRASLDPVSAGPKMGDLQEFLRNYNAIDEVLLGAGAAIEDRPPHAIRRRIPLTRIAEILYRSGRIDQHLFSELRDLITLRNSIIHGADPAVSQDAVARSAEMLKCLRAALDDPRDGET